MAKQFKYGNWIRKKVLWILGLSALGLGVLCFLPLAIYLRVLIGVLFLMVFISFILPCYAYIKFAPRGGNLQDKVYQLIARSLGEQSTGTILDIGTGNGMLAIKLTQTYPQTQVIGLDYWGKNWEYSKAVCEENAQLAQVAEYVHFVQGDAAALEFEDATFDAVVSNLTFHEVRSAANKRDVVLEALRVLKPGGSFAFMDYFYDSHYYGPALEFEAFLHSLGLARLALKPLPEVMALPALLRHPKILGKAGLIYGTK
jgi:SAM-dependent methyltransferase